MENHDELLHASLDERLLNMGVVWLVGEITHKTAAEFAKKLKFLELSYYDAGKPDKFRALCYVSSPGGEVAATLGLVDFIRSLGMPLSVFGVGQVASAAVWVIASFPKGQRYAFENTRFLLHEGWLSAEGKPSDVGAYHREEQRNARTLIKMLSDFTNKPVERFKPLLTKEYYFGALEAKRLGIIDIVVTPDD